jgi:hypothetical protein
MQVCRIWYGPEKAFDCVSHDVLLKKLKYYGINDKQYDLYKSYLLNRKQRTAILNGTDSSKVNFQWVKVTNGVPQGPILGPLNAFPFHLHMMLVFFISQANPIKCNVN